MGCNGSQRNELFRKYDSSSCKTTASCPYQGFRYMTAGQIEVMLQDPENCIVISGAIKGTLSGIEAENILS